MFGTTEDQTSYGLMNQNRTNMILTAICMKMILKWSQWVNVATIKSSILEILEGIRSRTKLRRIVAWIILFKNKLLKSIKKKPEDTDAGMKCNVNLLNEAENIMLKLYLKQCLFEEISGLSKTVESKSLAKKSSSIYSLDPILNHKGILCVRSRLKRSPLNEFCIHPVLPPEEGYITQLIIQWSYDKIQHSGRRITSSELRSRGYWVINGNAAVRRLISKCLIFKKLRGNTCQQKMSDLPVEWLTVTPPFTYVGLDLFRPFIVKEGRKELKQYGAIFTCLSFRGVHLEVINSMDTNCFIQSLRRFIARLGSVRLIKYDNGTSFVGGRNELKHAFTMMDDNKNNFS